MPWRWDRLNQGEEGLISDLSMTRSNGKRQWWGYVARTVGVLILALIGSVFIAQRLSDGPLNELLPGGALRAGEPASGADLATALAEMGSCTDGVCPPMKPIELELVGPGTSRYTGIMVSDGQVYIPCDLGFMWGRFSGNQRNVLHLIYIFKHWHEDALRDGRVVVRVDGKRYEGQAVRVTDAATDAALRTQLEDMARQWVAPAPLAAAPTEGPNDIWFFRIDPRPTI
jgi:hypothetical protein